MRIKRFTNMINALILILTVAGGAAMAIAEPGGNLPPPVMPEQPAPLLVNPRELPMPAVEKVGKGLYRIGDVTIDKAARTISFPAQVNMQQGLLEYILVRTGGKTHESLLRTKAEPYHLQLACLLLGLEGTDRPLLMQGAPELPKGEPVTITVSVTGQDGKSLVVSPERWIRKQVGEKAAEVEPLSLVFTGSIVSNGVFMAQLDGSIIALFHDPSALIDNASPGGESDKIWFVNEASVPPVGTPVTVTINALK